MRCPVCGKQFALDAPNVALPFCSDRCKSIDLNRWLNEEYSVDSVNIDRLEKAIAEGEGTEGAESEE